MRVLLERYPDDRYQPTAAADPRFLTNSPPIESAVGNLVEQQPTEVGKIVSLESFERWKLGKGVLNPAPELERVVA